MHGMLAVQLGEAQPPVFRVHRPATGRAPRLMRLEELHTRCEALCLHVPSAFAGGALMRWIHRPQESALAGCAHGVMLATPFLPSAHAIRTATPTGTHCPLCHRYQRMPEEAAKQLWETAYQGAGREGPSGQGGRLRRISLLGGLVLPVWDVLQAALEQQKFARDRKLSVLRLQTSGAPFLCTPVWVWLCLRWAQGRVPQGDWGGGGGGDQNVHLRPAWSWSDIPVLLPWPAGTSLSASLHRQQPARASAGRWPGSGPHPESCGRRRGVPPAGGHRHPGGRCGRGPLAPVGNTA